MIGRFAFTPKMAMRLLLNNSDAVELSVAGTGCPHTSGVCDRQPQARRWPVHSHEDGEQRHLQPSGSFLGRLAMGSTSTEHQRKGGSP